MAPRKRRDAPEKPLASTPVYRYKAATIQGLEPYSARPNQ